MMEMERIRYLIANYLRSRIWKIESQARFLLKERDEGKENDQEMENTYNRLSAAEKQYCEE